MKEVSSSESIICRGIQYREQGLTKPALQADQGVNALVVIFRDGVTEVCCPYLTKASTSIGANKCSAGCDSTEPKQVLPNCIFQKVERGTKENPDLISRLEELMKEKEWNQQKLSDKSGVHASLISRIMTGKTKNPIARTIENLERALGKKLRTHLPIDSSELS